jgi:tRNA-intron endonuclease
VGLAALRKLAKRGPMASTPLRPAGTPREGFVVTPGIKYGCDFAVYEQGPGIDHAPYIIQVMNREDSMSATEIVKAGRLASTVRKTFIAALPGENGVEYLEFKWWKS